MQMCAMLGPRLRLWKFYVTPLRHGRKMHVTDGMRTHGHSLKAPTEVAYRRLLVPWGIYVAPSRGHAE